MSISRAFIKSAVAVAMASVTFLTSSAFGQSPAAEDPKPKNVQSEIEALKTENAAVRELLRKMEEQQKLLLEQVSRLQRRLDGEAAPDASSAAQPAGSDGISKCLRATGIHCLATGQQGTLSRWHRHLGNS